MKNKRKVCVIRKDTAHPTEPTVKRRLISTQNHVKKRPGTLKPETQKRIGPNNEFLTRYVTGVERRNVKEIVAAGGIRRNKTEGCELIGRLARMYGLNVTVDGNANSCINPINGPGPRAHSSASDTVKARADKKDNGSNVIRTRKPRVHGKTPPGLLQHALAAARNVDHPGAPDCRAQTLPTRTKAVGMRGAQEGSNHSELHTSRRHKPQGKTAPSLFQHALVAARIAENNLISKNPKSQPEKLVSDAESLQSEQNPKTTKEQPNPKQEIISTTTKEQPNPKQEMISTTQKTNIDLDLPHRKKHTDSIKSSGKSAPGLLLQHALHAAQHPDAASGPKAHHTNADRKRIPKTKKDKKIPPFPIPSAGIEATTRQVQVVEDSHTDILHQRPATRVVEEVYLNSDSSEFQREQKPTRKNSSQIAEKKKLPRKKSQQNARMTFCVALSGVGLLASGTKRKSGLPRKVATARVKV